ncbi:type II toxin-antitoxin system PemK/MazF family toxin [Gephyromycinifex aptenodytis]|uniref:type II toxin-antitoxin system PemK/MazF family toxin n=1 Tax=Gephyromycinifex aptenodytis TaxID=2716227 RepID=UPI003855E066
MRTRQALRFLANAAQSLVRALPDPKTLQPPSAPSQRVRIPGVGAPGSKPSTDYPGDFTGTPTIDYTPSSDGCPDPGEVVWAWVTYEEDPDRGKDRPVLLIGRDGPWLLGLPLTSKDHDLDAAQEASQGRYWADIGTGSWDSQGRPSEARLDRIVRVAPATVRREGATVPRDVFERVVKQVHQIRG